MQTKPGVKTTEFWLMGVLALAGPTITFLISSGVFNPEVGEQLIIVVSNIVSLLAAAGYAKNRSDVKIAADEAATDAALMAERISVRAQATNFASPSGAGGTEVKGQAGGGS